MSTEPIANPHDSFFKQVMAQPEMAMDFMRAFLPADIVETMDLTTIELSPQSFVDDALKAHHTDLLFQLKLQSAVPAFVYVLFEHKSYPDRQVAFQLLRYIVRVWEHTQRRYKTLLPVIPVVFYHGQATWNIGDRLSWLAEAPPAFREFMPDFRFWLCDLSAIPDDVIRSELNLCVALTALKYVGHDDVRSHILEALRLMANAGRQQSTMEYLASVLVYLVTASEKLTAEDLREIVNEVFPEEGEMIMNTIAENWVRQGLQQGLQEGLQQGREAGLHDGRREGFLAAILLGLELRFGPDGLKLMPEIFKIDDPDVLRTVQEALKHVESPEDLRRFYQP